MMRKLHDHHQEQTGTWSEKKDTLLKIIMMDAPVVYSFVGTCIMLYLLSATFVPGLAEELAIHDRFQENVWNTPCSYVNLVSHILVHSNWKHLQVNMVYLLLIGPSIEQKVGSKMMLRIIVLVDVCSAFTHLAVGTEGTYQLGASGVVIACLLLGCIVNTTPSQEKVPFSIYLVSFVCIWNQVMDVTRRPIEDKSFEEISHHAHVSGGIVAILIGCYIYQQSRP